MSEFTDHKKARVEQLVRLFEGILKADNLGELVRENHRNDDTFGCDFAG